MGKISSIVGKMPFAGRAAVENAALAAYSERRSKEAKISKSIGSITFLAFFSAMHGLQAHMGATDTLEAMKDIQTNPNILNFTKLAIAGLYTIANTGVMYTQAEIGLRVADNCIDFCSNFDETSSVRSNYRFSAQIPTAEEVGFTLAGQAIFIAQHIAL